MTATPDETPVITSVDPAPAPAPAVSPSATAVADPAPPSPVLDDPSPVTAEPLTTIPASKVGLILGRQPVALLGAVQAFLVLLVSTGALKGIGISGTTDVAIIVGALTALTALYTAWKTDETILSPLIQAFQAVLSFGALYGLHLSDSQQGYAIAAITAIVSLFHTTQVTPLAVGSFRLKQFHL